jgi:uncharacterized protein
MINPVLLAFVGVVIGLCVGLTGIGGGALMTPALVLLGVDPITAVASDLVVSLVMKPIGAGVHLKRGTVNRSIVGWLSLGSLPAAFGGAVAIELLHDSGWLKGELKRVIGVALVLAVGGMVVRARLRPGSVSAEVLTRRGPTVLVGIIGGLMVGLTSVGSGSLMIVGLMLLYPTLEQRKLVGTDLAQAIPLVGAAALGHALFGRVDFGLALPLLMGALPAVYIGSRLSSGRPLPWLRPLLMVLLMLSASQLLGVPVAVIGLAGALTAVCWCAQALIRRANWTKFGLARTNSSP